MIWYANTFAKMTGGFLLALLIILTFKGWIGITTHCEQLSNGRWCYSQLGFGPGYTVIDGAWIEDMSQ